MTAHPWRSERLIYRSINMKEDVPLFVAIDSDADAHMASSPYLPKPPDMDGTEEHMKRMKKGMLSIVICLPEDAMDSESAAGTPVGFICLMAPPEGMGHHRHAMVGLNILRDHQREGYGSEAIKWALRWGFQYANLHKIELGYFGWNTEAGRLYRKLGFVDEGRKRDHFWHDGAYYDEVILSMLESEWREQQRKKE